MPATGRWDDFASFMVPRKPGGGGCVCVVYRNSSLDGPGRIAYMRGLCESEPGPGVLAYVDGLSTPRDPDREDLGYLWPLWGPFLSPLFKNSSRSASASGVRDQR